jgi:hypothetical protein
MSVSAVSPAESRFVRFIVFTDTGDRYYFGPSRSLGGLRTTWGLRAIRKAPAEVGSGVASAFWSMGYSCLVAGEKMICIRAQNLPGRHDFEMVAVVALPGKGFVLGPIQSPLWHYAEGTLVEPFASQHALRPPSASVMTATGTCVVEFVPPCAHLRRLIGDGTYSAPVNDYMIGYHGNAESCGAALLVAALWPSESDPALFVATEFSRRESEADCSVLSEGFYLRVARLLTQVWGSPVFDPESCRIMARFSYMPGDVVLQLQEIPELINRALLRQEAFPDSATRRLQGVEKSQLGQLSEFVKMMVEMLKLIRLLSTQRAALLASPLRNCPQGTRHRLTKNSFCQPDASVLLADALRELAQRVVRDAREDALLEIFLGLLCEECPTLLRVVALQIEEATANLTRALCLPENERRRIVRASVGTFIEYCHEDQDITGICDLLFELGCLKEVVQVVAARAHAIDGVERGLNWYKNGQSEHDTGGKRVFGKLVQCYDAGIDQLNREEWLAELLATPDELFHIAYFQALIEKGEEESLLSVASPYLEDFLKNDRRSPVRILLWQVYAKKRQYVEAAKDIKALLQNPTGWNKSKQIGMMRHGANMARLGRDDGLAEEFFLLIRDHEFLQQVGGEPPVVAQLYSFVRDSLTDETDRAKEISKSWRDYTEYLVTKALPGKPDKQLEAIRKLLGKFPKSSLVVDPRVMVAPFEDWRWLAFQGDRPLVVPELLIACGISGAKLSDAYVDLIVVILPQVEGPVPEERVDQLVYAAVWLVARQYGNPEHIEKIRRQIDAAAKRRPFDGVIRACFARIPYISL